MSVFFPSCASSINFCSKLSRRRQTLELAYSRSTCDMSGDKAGTSGANTSNNASNNLSFTLVAEDVDAMATSQDLRAALEKGTDEVKYETLRRIIISTLNGQPHVSFFLSRTLLCITTTTGETRLGGTCHALNSLLGETVVVVSFYILTKL